MGNAPMKDFAEQVQEAAQQSVVSTLKSGEWLSLNYANKVAVTSEQLREVYQSIDMSKVAEILKAKLEHRLADTLFNALATEVATDVKKIMGNTELREDCRAVIRDKIRQAARGLE
jgi:hypothetical protein